MLFKIAWRNIWRSRRRSLITIASILFAVFFAVLARSFQLGMYEKMISTMVGNSSGYIQLHTKGYWDDQTIDNSLETDLKSIPVIEEIEGVENLVPRIDGFALGAFEDITRAVRVNGIDPIKEHQLTGLKDFLIEGEYLSDSSDHALVTEGLSSFFDLSVGDTIYLLGQGYRANNAAGRYRVGGILKFGHPTMNSAGVYLPIKEAQWFFSAPGLATAFVMDLNEPSRMEDIRKETIEKVDTSAVEVMSWEEMMPELIQAIKMDSTSGIIMIFILYMVVSFGIFGTILMMTAERKTEFGVMVAIGMKKHLLSLVMVLEVAILSFIGIIAGLLFALPVAYYFNRYPIEFTGQAAEAIREYDFEPVIPTSTDIDIALTHGSIVLAIAILLSLYSVFYIYQLKAVKAMRG